MFGLLFGSAKIDAYRAEVIHTYLGAYHRTYNMLGFESLIGTIQSNKLISGFRQLKDGFRTFVIPGDLNDFEFFISKTDLPGARAITAYGRNLYRGFLVTVTLETGKYSFFTNNPTPRATNLGNLFETKYDAQRRKHSWQ